MSAALPKVPVELLDQLMTGDKPMTAAQINATTMALKKAHFPSDDAATKLIWLALRNITSDWGRAAN